jgi:hypothetical protein
VDSFATAAKGRDDDKDDADAGLFASYFGSKRALVLRRVYCRYKGRACHFVFCSKDPKSRISFVLLVLAYFHCAL